MPAGRKMSFLGHYRKLSGSMIWRLIVRFVLALCVGFSAGQAAADSLPPTGWILARGDPNGVFLIDAARGNIIRTFPTVSGGREQSGQLLPTTETAVVSGNARLIAISQPSAGVQVWDKIGRAHV